MLDVAMIALLFVVDIGVEIGGGLLIAVEMREEVEFADGAFVRCNERFAGWIDLCILLSASSRYFISISSPSMMSLTSSGGTACPLRRSQSCFALMNHNKKISNVKRKLRYVRKKS